MGRRSTHTPDQLRELIISAATELIEEQGLANLSAREIARRVGYSPGTIYNVFRDLDDLIYTIEARMLDTLALRIANIPDQDDPVKRLSDMASAYLAFTNDRPQLWNLLMEHVPQTGVDVPPEFRCRIDSLIAEVERVVKCLIGDDDPARVHRVTTVLWTALHGISTLATSRKLPHVSAADAGTLVHDFVETYARGLTAAASSGHPRRPGKRSTGT